MLFKNNCSFFLKYKWSVAEPDTRSWAPLTENLAVKELYSLIPNSNLGQLNG